MALALVVTSHELKKFLAIVAHVELLRGANVFSPCSVDDPVLGCPVY
jgi:hypothetical protein